MMTVVLDRDDMRRTLVRIAHEIVEKNPDGAVALIGIHRRGAVLAKRLQALTSELLEPNVPLGDVDISFYRDDFAIRPSAPVVRATHLEFPVDHRTIVIVDDVLYTGRTVRAAIDVIFDYGRPARVQLAVLIDRGHPPAQAQTRGNQAERRRPVHSALVVKAHAGQERASERRHQPARG